MSLGTGKNGYHAIGFKTAEQAQAAYDRALKEMRAKNPDFNVRAKRSDNKSGFKGVRWAGWQAAIGNYGKQYNLGYFDTAEEAARAYDKAARELHGKFARLNFSA